METKLLAKVWKSNINIHKIWYMRNYIALQYVERNFIPETDTHSLYSPKGSKAPNDNVAKMMPFGENQMATL